MPYNQNQYHRRFVGATLVVAQNKKMGNKTVGDMVDAFKSITTVAYIRGIKIFGWQPFDAKLWQRNYHEHIIRDGQSYETIASYIVNNPATWNDDIFCSLITS